MTAAIVCGWWLVTAVGRLDAMLVERLSGRRWQLPSRIYAESFVLYPGRALLPTEFVMRLDDLGYSRSTQEPITKGTYRVVQGNTVEVRLRDLERPDRVSPGDAARVSFRLGLVTSIENLDGVGTLESVELEPDLIAGIYDRVWESRRPVRVTELPARLVDAVLAAEDRRFFEHHGIDSRGVVRALLANLRSGRVVQGGSTLTQQLIKNFFLTPARTWRRKVVEAVMALLLERRYSKLQILEIYLNEIYFGQRGAMGVHGVVEAARFYFGKDPQDLTLAESAMLAGLIRAPGRFAPTRNPDRARARREQVLSGLLAAGKISHDEYDRAGREPLPARLPVPELGVAPYFVDFVRSELENRYSQEDLVSQGFRIFTTLDVALELAAQQAVERGLRRLERQKPEWANRAAGDRLQAAIIAIRPATGEIRAMVGGRSYAESQFNRATQARRQIGSLFKSVVALAAFEQEERAATGRFSSTRRIEDAPFVWRYAGQTWSPANFGGKYRGHVSFREAIEQSLNAATARIAEEVGLESIRDLATRLGIPTLEPIVPSLVLGAVEASPLEIAKAYAAIASLGFRSETMSIRSVLDADRRPLERATLSAEQSVSPRVAYLTTSLLEGVVDRGTARAIRAAGLHGPIAGKTGTTNEGRDAWFVGFVPDLLTVVWVGFDRGEPAGLTGSEAALPIWIDFMKEALADWSPTPFLIPPGIRFADVDPSSGAIATARCPRRITESFFDGSDPIVACPFHPDVDPTGAPKPMDSTAPHAIPTREVNP